MRLLELTSDELGQVPKDTNVYEGVGKMWVTFSETPLPQICQLILPCLWFQLFRFVATPLPKVNQRLSKELQDVKTEVVNLDKKLHYLETTQKNSRDHIDQLFRAGGKS
jgi:prefoldin subunit 1